MSTVKTVKMLVKTTLVKEVELILYKCTNIFNLRREPLYLTFEIMGKDIILEDSSLCRYRVSLCFPSKTDMQLAWKLLNDNQSTITEGQENGNYFIYILISIDHICDTTDIKLLDWITNVIEARQEIHNFQEKINQYANENIPEEIKKSMEEKLKKEYAGMKTVKIKFKNKESATDFVTAISNIEGILNPSILTTCNNNLENYYFSVTFQTPIENIQPIEAIKLIQEQILSKMQPYPLSITVSIKIDDEYRCGMAHYILHSNGIKSEIQTEQSSTYAHNRLVIHLNTSCISDPDCSIDSVKFPNLVAVEQKSTKDESQPIEESNYTNENISFTDIKTVKIKFKTKENANELMKLISDNKEILNPRVWTYRQDAFQLVFETPIENIQPTDLIQKLGLIKQACDYAPPITIKINISDKTKRGAAFSLLTSNEIQVENYSTIDNDNCIILHADTNWISEPNSFWRIKPSNNPNVEKDSLLLNQVENEIWGLTDNPQPTKNIQIRLEIPVYVDREKIISALANSGINVKVEPKALFTRHYSSNDSGHFIIFEIPEECIIKKGE